MSKRASRHGSVQSGSDGKDVWSREVKACMSRVLLCYDHGIFFSSHDTQSCYVDAQREARLPGIGVLWMRLGDAGGGAKKNNMEAEAQIIKQQRKNLTVLIRRSNGVALPIESRLERFRDRPEWEGYHKLK